MKLLLDTHALIWFVEDDEKLPNSLSTILGNRRNQIFISIATLWEIAIKISLEKLVINKTFEEVLHLIKSNGFEIIPISEDHLSVLLKLPFFHRDPFDRILASQSLVGDFVFVSKDIVFDSYNINRLWK